MSCANSVFPVFMAAPGPKPGRLPELAIAVQIDTTLPRLEIRVSHGFQRFDHSFNRTVRRMPSRSADGQHPGRKDGSPPTTRQPLRFGLRHDGKDESAADESSEPLQTFEKLLGRNRVAALHIGHGVQQRSFLLGRSKKRFVVFTGEHGDYGSLGEGATVQNDLASNNSSCSEFHSVNGTSSGRGVLDDAERLNSPALGGSVAPRRMSATWQRARRGSGCDFDLANFCAA